MKAKPMNSPKKEKRDLSTLFTILKTTYSNQACIDASVKKTWWISFIIFIVSIFIAVIPTTVQASKQTGSTLVSGQTYGFREALIDTVNDISYTEKEGKLAQIDIKDKKAVLDTTSLPVNERFFYLGYHKSYQNTDSIDAKVIKDLDLYYISQASIDQYTYETIAKEIGTYSYPYDETTGDVDVTSDKIARKCSYIVFTPNNYYVTIYSLTDNTVKTSFACDYQYFEDTNVVTFLTKENTKEDANERIFENFKQFCELGYKNPNKRLVLIQAGIALAMNAGIGIIVWLFVFLLSRGKNNPMRILKWYQCIGISFFSSFTPAILALALGFILPQFATMYFVLMYAFRMMFLSMKFLRPAN